MFKRSFISLSFTSKKLQVVKVDRSSRVVEKLSSHELPAGVIVNHIVAKPDELTSHIKEALKQSKVKDKSVGIVVPEYSTYTKLIQLPKLSGEELDEAVRWHSQDFLPTGSAEMVMDWKIVRSGETEITVLAVAIAKQNLSGYVDAASKAGLMPLLVETPSLSLVRVSGEDEKGKLIIYVSVDEAVLIISQGQSILASSVASSNSQNEIIQTAWRMMSHYSTVNVEEILVGGLGLSESFLTNVKNYLKRPVGRIMPEYKKISPEQVQEYLIPLSLQLKEPDQPEDEFSINLLPAEWVKHYKKKLQEVRYWTLTLMGSFVVWIGFLAVIIIYMLFVGQMGDYEAKASEVRNPEAEKVYSEVKDVNNISSTVLNIDEQIQYPQEILNKAIGARPDGVRIKYSKVDMENGTLVISGTANDRSSLITFKQALENVSEFNDVNLPVSSLVSETNLNFEISFTFGEQKQKSVPKLKLQ